MERVRVSVIVKKLPAEFIESATSLSAILSDETSNFKKGTIESSIVKWDLEDNTWERGFVFGCVQEFTLTISKQSVLTEEQNVNVTFLLHSILEEPTGRSIFSVPFKNHSVSFEISATVVGGLRDLFSTQFSLHLEKRPWFFSNRKYYVAVSNRVNDYVWKSSVTRYSPSAGIHWGTASSSCKDLCDNNFNAELDVKLWKYKLTGNHTLKGQATMTLAGILSAHRSDGKVSPLQLQSPDSPAKIADLGIYVPTRDVNTAFLDYIREGWRFKVSIVMDFSNSHEYIHKSGGPRSICSDILAELTSSFEVLQWFRGPDLYGFDAHLSQPSGGHSVVSHFFHQPSATLLSSSQQGLSVQERVQADYSAMLGRVEAHGRCVKLFSPILSAFLRSNRVAQEYSVVFVVSNREMSDFATHDTIANIAAASALPLSIVFIGGLASLPVEREQPSELGSPKPSTRSVRSCSVRSPSTTTLHSPSSSSSSLLSSSSSSSSITAGSTGTGTGAASLLSEQSCGALNAHAVHNADGRRREIFSFVSASEWVGCSFLSAALSKVPEQMMQYFDHTPSTIPITGR